MWAIRKRVFVIDLPKRPIYGAHIHRNRKASIVAWADPETNPLDNMGAVELLALWERKQQELEAAKKAEKDLRERIYKLAFPSPKEGTNRVPLKNGYSLKAVRKISRKFVVPTDFGMIGDREPKVIDAVERLDRELRQHSNSAAFIADRLIKYSATMSDSEYKSLPDDIKPIVNKYVESSDQAPTLEIIPPKENG